MLMSTFVTNICSAAIGTSENSNFASDVLIRFVSNHGSVIGYDLFITVNAISSRWNQKKTRRDQQKKKYSPEHFKYPQTHDSRWRVRIFEENSTQFII